MKDQIAANKRRAALLVAGFVAAVVLLTWALGQLVGYGPVGLGAGLVLAAAAVSGAYWKSGAIALAMSHARPADEGRHARLHNVVEGLCITAGLPKPSLYVVEDGAPNAFATGRNPRHAAVAVTTGLLETMSRIELEAVLGHELSHVKSYDILVSTLSVTLVGAVALVADFALRFLWWGGPRHRDDRRGAGAGAGAPLALVGLVPLLLAPLAARAMRCSVSRRRELAADVAGVSLTRYPPGLISALEKLREGSTVVHSASPATAHLWLEVPTAQDPSQGRLAWLNRMFNTHPPLEERIQALREL